MMIEKDIKEIIELYHKDGSIFSTWSKEELKDLLHICHKIMTDRILTTWNGWLNDAEIIAVHHIIDMAAYYQGYNKAK